MPTYSLRQHDNGTFYVHWTEGRRSRRVTTGAVEEAEAQTFLAHWILGAREDAIDAAATFLVSDLWTLYFEKHVEKNNADTRSAKTVWRNLSVHFGTLKLADFEVKNEDDEDKVDEYIRLRQEGKIGDCPGAPGTIRGELAILKACLNWCAKKKQKYIKPSDVPTFDLPPDSEPRDRWLRTEEIQRLVNSAGALRGSGRVTLAERAAGLLSKTARLSRAERVLWLALETAARLMAILELTWDRVDFEMNVIHYNVPGRKRTKKRRASVPISKALRPILERAYAERINEFVCDSQALTIWRTLQTIATHAKVADVSPHVLRHTAATHMCRRGVSLWIVAGILGDSVETVEKTYGHHVPEGLAGGVELISGGLLEPAE